MPEPSQVGMSFQCPHCHGTIHFSVDGYVPDDEDYEFDYEGPTDTQYVAYNAAADLYDRETRRYQDTQDTMRHAIETGRYTEAVALIHENMELLPGFVEHHRAFEEKKREIFGGIARPMRFFPVLKEGARVLALEGDADGLARMREIVDQTTGLEWFSGDFEGHQKELKTCLAIRNALRETAECPQPEVKLLIGEADGRYVSNVISRLEKAGKIVRRREGKNIYVSLAQN